jgi:hypothetical protein
MTSPATILADALQSFDRVYREKIARRAGVAIGTVNRATGARPISADHLLRIAAAMGLNPINGADLPHRDIVGELDRGQLAIAVRMTLSLRGQSIRAASKAAGVSATVFVRLMNGELTSIESVLGGCRYVGLHPFEYLRTASREAVEGTSRSQQVAA